MIHQEPEDDLLFAEIRPVWNERTISEKREQDIMMMNQDPGTENGINTFREVPCLVLGMGRIDEQNVFGAELMEQRYIQILDATWQMDAISWER